MQMMTVNQIQYFSLYDGPGIRTTVFLQGCNLRCAWCHNPETWSLHASVSYAKERCVQCGACGSVCPSHAHIFDENKHLFEPEKCIRCGACAEACCTEALELNGTQYSAAGLYEKLVRDQRLYEISNGGVTFSGGEPLLQWEALEEICVMLRKNGIHVAMETALDLPWKTVQRSQTFTDLFLIDCKIFDENRHRAYTGKSNRQILDNLRKLAETSNIEIRIPVIERVNTDAENAENTAAYLAGLGERIKSVELLPYHDFGIAKAAHVGITQKKFGVPSDEQIAELRRIFRKYHLNVK